MGCLCGEGRTLRGMTPMVRKPHCVQSGDLQVMWFLITREPGFL